MLVRISSEAPMKVAGKDTKHNVPSMPPHPAHPLGHYHQLLYLPTQATVADILQQVSGKIALSLSHINLLPFRFIFYVFILDDSFSRS